MFVTFISDLTDFWLKDPDFIQLPDVFPLHLGYISVNLIKLGNFNSLLFEHTRNFQIYSF